MGVFGLQWQDADIWDLLGGDLQYLDGVPLIVLDADIPAIDSHHLHQYLDSGEHILRVLQHQPVIGGEVRFALGAIEYDGIDHLALGRGQFHMGGKARAPQSHDPRRRDAFAQGLGVLSPPIHGGKCRVPFILAVILYGDGHDLAPVGMYPGRDGLDCAGDASVDGCADVARGLPDQLSHLDMVSRLHRRQAGRSDMLGHRDMHQLGGLGLYDGLVFRIMFFMGWM